MRRRSYHPLRSMTRVATPPVAAAVVNPMPSWFAVLQDLGVFLSRFGGGRYSEELAPGEAENWDGPDPAAGERTGRHQTHNL